MNKQVLYKTMKNGSRKQKEAYWATEDLGILRSLAAYDPVVCGTIPIGVDHAQSDIDIILECGDLKRLEVELTQLFSQHPGFRIKCTTLRNLQAVKSNFYYKGFEFEIVGQPQPVLEQHAFLHMWIEYQVLKQFPELREKVLRLREKSLKTESAFCKALGIEGDPYAELIKFGKDRGWV